VYHVSPGKGQQSEVVLVFEVDILDENIKSSTKVELLFLISREGMSRGRLAEYLSAQNAVSSKTLRPILFSEEVLSEIRRQVKKKTKHTVDLKELKDALQRMLAAEKT